VASKITTLYISDTGIQLMVARGKRISKLAEAPLDINLADVSVKVREAEIVAKIRHLLKFHKIKEKKVIIGLSGLHCLSRPIVLPQLPRAMLDEAVIREAKRVLPVPTEQLYISWQVMSTTEGKIQAFMVAIPQHMADTLLGVLQQVGLKPYQMDIKPLALARLVPEATAIVIDVQSREFDIVIMSNGIPQPIRTVAFPREVLSLPDKLPVVRDELERTIQFFNSNNPEKSIQPGMNVYVSGELADAPELYESLTKELGYRVLPLPSPLKCPKQLDPAHYLINIGLALKELRREPGPLLANLNTLPVSYQPKPVSLTKIIALPAAAIAIGLMVLLAMTIQDATASIDSVQGKLDATNFILGQRQAQKKELTEEIAALSKKLASTEAECHNFTNTLDNIGKQGDSINGDLVTTVSNLVSGVSLKSIAHSGQNLNIAGQAPTEEEVLSYARNLDASGRFPEVTVASIKRVKPNSDNGTEHMDFALALKLGEEK
jgi:type IV pilus assembly protein PilM